jgi:tryptophan synthase beta subunit
MQMNDLPDARGRFGPYGGVFVAETLIAALDELRDQYARYQHDPAFIAESQNRSSSTMSAGRARSITPSAGRKSSAARRSISSART